MAPRATVLIPTFDHGETLLFAVRSALRQTIEDIEVFVVGDGVPPLSRRFIEELIEDDPRIRFFANDKGPRHGEIHRARALEEASGEIVCYLADDDLWFPEHVESMLALLEDADFANSLPLRVEPTGALGGWAIDLGREADRKLLLGGENRVPLSFSGHTLAAYRRLPHGWRTTPDDVPTDLYMFQQFLSCDWVRAVSGFRATGLHFPSPDRIHWSSEQRIAELERWARRVGDGDYRRGELANRVVAIQARGWTRSDAEVRELRLVRAALDHRLADLERRSRSDRERLERTTGEAVELKSDLEDALATSQSQVSRIAILEKSLEEAQSELEWRDRSLTWRARRALLSLPLVGGFFRWAGRARARKADR